MKGKNCSPLLFSYSELRAKYFSLTNVLVPPSSNVLVSQCAASVNHGVRQTGLTARDDPFDSQWVKPAKSFLRNHSTRKNCLINCNPSVIS